MCSPSLNNFTDQVWPMDPTIIHNDDRVWAWKWVHVIKEAINKPCERIWVIWPFNDFHSEDSAKRDSREDWKSMMVLVVITIEWVNHRNLLPRTNTVLLAAHWPLTARAYPWEIRRSQALSSTNTNCSGWYLKHMRYIYIAHTSSSLSIARQSACGVLNQVQHIV